MGALDGRIAIITGAGRGLGREHALLFAQEGAKVVVNDLGGDMHGEGADRAPAQQVVDEIEKMGGEAVANLDSAADWDGAQRLIRTAIDTFGDLHVLVNNAGILRDRVIVNMTEEEWDAVIHVHLKGHFCPTRHAAAYWREQSKAGKEVKASIVHTSSTSGLLGNPGQANYGAAKSGIATFSYIASLELGRYGVRSNAIAPAARTRLTEQTPGLQDAVKAPEDESKFDGGVRRTCPRSSAISPPRTARSRAGVPRPGRRRAAVPAVEAVREDRQGRPLDRRRARKRGLKLQPAEK
jgi:NAD(P)-dependent dehydrogenase (short-subunit alcohol dehydrogenase family)